MQPSRKPSVQPTSQPTFQPSHQPSMQPSSLPSGQPSNHPTIQPSSQPSCQPSMQPSVQPSCLPSSQPSLRPSLQPTARPTEQPSDQPSSQPSRAPSTQPSGKPSAQPSVRPSRQPSAQPSTRPSLQPSCVPSSQPSNQPTDQPTKLPSGQPTARPSFQPTNDPSEQPSSQPTNQPSIAPTGQPSQAPSEQPSSVPTVQPTNIPSMQPTYQPSGLPSGQPTNVPSVQPSIVPTLQPTGLPSCQPSVKPSSQPSAQPSLIPSSQPLSDPSSQPSRVPSGQPSSQPTCHPSALPTGQPSFSPSMQPTTQPTSSPTAQPSQCPTLLPSNQPTSQPSGSPTRQPSAIPSTQPTSHPTGQPSSQPSVRPSAQPTYLPTNQPSRQPSAQPSCYPSSQPTSSPSKRPTCQPSCHPTSQPSLCPFSHPTTQPSSVPTVQPSAPTAMPVVLSLSALPYNASHLSVQGTNSTHFKIVLPFQNVDLINNDAGFHDVQFSCGIAGTNYVLFGGRSLPSAISLPSVPYGRVFSISNVVSYDFTARSVSNAGDVNGDGYDDLIIGVPYQSRCYVLFGNQFGFRNMTRGFTVHGATPSDATGWSVGSAGFVNGDRYGDIIIGAPYAAVDGATNAGKVYILYGKRNLFADVYLSSLSPYQGYSVSGTASGDFFGLSVSCAGDVNGDNHTDLVVGALRIGLFNAGSAYVLFGGASTATMNVYLNMSQGFAVTGGYYQRLGCSVSGAGDVNGDGYSDVLVGSVNQISTASNAYLIYGRTTASLSSFSISTMQSSQGVVLSGGGVVVSAVGDINADGYADVMIGSDYGASSGGFVFLTSVNYTYSPSMRPTMSPTTAPSKAPSVFPTKFLSRAPSLSPTTIIPSAIPSIRPSRSPSLRPSAEPTTISPTLSGNDSYAPSEVPTPLPSAPSSVPSSVPTSSFPTSHPTVDTEQPTARATSEAPTESPTDATKPTIYPTAAPFHRPTRLPTFKPTRSPSLVYQILPVTSGGNLALSSGNYELILNSTESIVITPTADSITMYTVLPIPLSYFEGVNASVFPPVVLTITSFHLSTDTINLEYFTHIRSFDELNITLGSVIITLSIHQRVRLLGLVPANMTSSHFVFCSVCATEDSVDNLGNNTQQRLAIIIGATVGGCSLLIAFLLYRWRLEDLRRKKIDAIDKADAEYNANLLLDQFDAINIGTDRVEKHSAIEYLRRQKHMYSVLVRKDQLEIDIREDIDYIAKSLVDLQAMIALRAVELREQLEASEIRNYAIEHKKTQDNDDYQSVAGHFARRQSRRRTLSNQAYDFADDFEYDYDKPVKQIDDAFYGLFEQPPTPVDDDPDSPDGFKKTYTVFDDFSSVDLLAGGGSVFSISDDSSIEEQKNRSDDEYYQTQNLYGLDRDNRRFSSYKSYPVKDVHDSVVQKRKEVKVLEGSLYSISSSSSNNSEHDQDEGENEKMNSVLIIDDVINETVNEMFESLAEEELVWFVYEESGEGGGYQVKDSDTEMEEGSYDGSRSYQSMDQEDH